jgi:hypothetical protein
MATLVKFRKDGNGVFAFFPQLNYNKQLYGTRRKVIYQHVGQHSGGDIDYCVDATIPAKESEYSALKTELESIGYTLKICK